MTADGFYVLFGAKDVRVLKEFKTPLVSFPRGHKTEVVYVLNAESAYVERAKGKSMADLWQQRMGHTKFEKLDLVMDKNWVFVLPK